MRCDGIRLVYLPCASDATITSKIKPVEVTIEKKKPKTAANVKRTPFEEDNYIACVWTRPLHLPLPNGPRCLRVLGPMSEMEITNLTQPVSSGRAVEGTVNRICLKLQAGLNEICRDVTFKIKLSSMLITPEGVTKNLSAANTEEDNTVSMKDPDIRTPMLVASNLQSKEPQNTDYGYFLPPGWVLNGTGQESDVQKGESFQTLKPNQSTYIFFELFRPSAVATGKIADTEEIWDTSATSDDLCQTDFEVSVSYRQDRQSTETNKGDSPSSNNTDATISEMVTQTSSGSVTWVAPLQASFYRGIRSACPSGSRHPSNLTDEARPSDTSIFSNIAMIDGERVSMRAVLQGDVSDKNGGFEYEILKIRFEVSSLHCMICFFV